MNDPLTLYKLMILYMLKKVTFPLTNSQMLQFFLDNDYTDYFTFQRVLNELETSGLVHSRTARNTSRYGITPQGEESLDCFVSSLSEAIIGDMDSFLSQHKTQLRNESSVTAAYEKTGGQEYMVHCQVTEGKNTVIRLDLTVPTVEQAETICDNWPKNSQAIYSHAVNLLLKP